MTSHHDDYVVVVRRCPVTHCAGQSIVVVLVRASSSIVVEPLGCRCRACGESVVKLLKLLAARGDGGGSLRLWLYYHDSIVRSTVLSLCGRTEARHVCCCHCCRCHSGMMSS